MKFARSHLGLALGAMLAFVPLALSISCLKGKSAAETTAQWTVNIQAGAHGSITPSGAMVLDAGSTHTLLVTPDNGYAIQSLTIDGKDVYTPAASDPIDAPYHYAFQALARSQVMATFVRTWTITASVDAASAGHGTITPAGAVKVREGDLPVFTLSPSSTGGTNNWGFYTSSLTMDGTDVKGSMELGTLTLPAVLADHVLVAGFSPFDHQPLPPVITALKSDFAFLASTYERPAISASVDYEQLGPAPVYTWTADHGTFTGRNPATYIPEAGFSGTAKITVSVTTGGTPVSKSLSLPIRAALDGSYGNIFGDWVDHLKIAVESDGSVFAASRNGMSAKTASRNWGTGLGYVTLAPGASAFSANTSLSDPDEVSWMSLATCRTDGYCIYKDGEEGSANKDKAFVTKNNVNLGAVSTNWVDYPCIAAAPSKTDNAKNAVYALNVGGPNWPPDTHLLVYDEGSASPAWTDVATSGGSPVNVLNGTILDALALALDNAGTPYVAYAPAGGKVQVTRLKADKSGYEVVGTDLSLGAIFDTSETDAHNKNGMRYSLNIAFDDANTPYVCFLDGGAAPAFMVRCVKFDSSTSTWVGVGNTAGSVSWSPQGGGKYAKAHYASMAVAGDGTVCIAFKDKADGSGDKMTAMMTTPNGSAGGWARVGRSYLSPDWVNYTSMAIGSGKKAWFLFKDGSMGGDGSAVELDLSSVVTVP